MSQVVLLGNSIFHNAVYVQGRTGSRWIGSTGLFTYRRHEDRVEPQAGLAGFWRFEGTNEAPACITTIGPTEAGNLTNSCQKLYMGLRGGGPEDRAIKNRHLGE